MGTRRFWSGLLCMLAVTLVSAVLVACGSGAPNADPEVTSVESSLPDPSDLLAVFSGSSWTVAYPASIMPEALVAADVGGVVEAVEFVDADSGFEMAVSVIAAPAGDAESGSVGAGDAADDLLTRLVNSYLTDGSFDPSEVKSAQVPVPGAAASYQARFVTDTDTGPMQAFLLTALQGDGQVLLVQVFVPAADVVDFAAVVEEIFASVEVTG